MIVKGKLKSDRDYSNYRLNCSVLGASGFANLSSCALLNMEQETQKIHLCVEILQQIQLQMVKMYKSFVMENTTTSTPMSIDCKNGVINQGYANAA